MVLCLIVHVSRRVGGFKYVKGVGSSIRFFNFRLFINVSLIKSVCVYVRGWGGGKIIDKVGVFEVAMEFWICVYLRKGGMICNIHIFCIFSCVYCVALLL